MKTETKKHVAKYLPVGGEITVGDRVIDKHEGLSSYCGISAEENGVHLFYTDDEHQDPWTSDAAYFHSQNKVKLFLCSKDVQVGDLSWGHNGAPYKNYKLEEVIIEKLPESEIDSSFSAVYPPHSTDECIIPSFPVYEPFKVVGEILTPGIKEGQEFTEEEASYLTLKS